MARKAQAKRAPAPETPPARPGWLAFFGADPIGNVIFNTFELMGVCEEEIEAAIRGGMRKDQGSVVFRASCPTPVLRGKPPLYREHVREIIARVTAGAKLAPGTKAEVLGSLLETSLTAPLNGAGQAFAECIFARLFPEDAARILPGGPRAGAWPGQIEEDFQAASKRLAVPDRDR